tara:strand:- start:1241 stop:1414 length:174 start_codon:yes stop_codon:yes gene_type:complete
MFGVAMVFEKKFLFAVRALPFGFQFRLINVKINDNGMLAVWTIFVVSQQTHNISPTK